MSKYVLAKDLPYVKAGTPVDIIDRNAQYEDVKTKFTKIEHVDDFGKITFTMIPNDKLDEWIEKVEPRMWYVPESILKEYGSSNKDKFFNGRVRHDLVKVIEALE